MTKTVLASAIGAAVLLGVLLWFWFSTETKSVTPMAKTYTPPKVQVAPTKAAPESPKCEPKRYTIVKGDTLISIAKREYQGQGHLYPYIAGANQKIKNPDLIYPGTEILVPCCEDMSRITPVFAKKIVVAPLVATATTPMVEKKEIHIGQSVEPLKISVNFIVTRKSHTLVPLTPKPSSRVVVPEASLPEAEGVTTPKRDTLPQNLQGLEKGENRISEDHLLYSADLAEDRVVGLTEAVFPALVLGRQVSKNSWQEKTKTKVVSTKTDQGFRLTILPTNFDKDFSAVVFDMGEMAGNSRMVFVDRSFFSLTSGLQTLRDGGVFKEEEYDFLLKSFSEKPSTFKKVFSYVGNAAIQSGLGFVFGGPVGAAVAGPVSLFSDIFSRKQREKLE